MEVIKANKQSKNDGGHVIIKDFCSRKCYFGKQFADIRSQLNLRKPCPLGDRSLKFNGRKKMPANSQKLFT